MASSLSSLETVSLRSKEKLVRVSANEEIGKKTI